MFIASNDFLRSAMVNEEDLDAGFPNGSPAADEVRVDEMLLLSLVTWAAAAEAVGGGGGGGPLSLVPPLLGSTDGGACSDW